MAADKYLCLQEGCGKQVAATKNNRYRSHTGQDGEQCGMSSEPIPPAQLELGPIDPKADPGVPEEGRDYAVCSGEECGRKVKLTKLGYFEPHDKTLRGGDRCPKSGTRVRGTVDIGLPPPVATAGEPAKQPTKPAGPSPSESAGSGPSNAGSPTPRVTVTISPAAISESAVAALNGISGKAEPTWREGRQIDWDKVGTESAPSAGSGVSTETNSRESVTISTLSPEPTGLSLSASKFLQPASPFLQPEKWKPEFLQPQVYEGPVKGEPMSPEARDLATRIKETFYSYSNRKTSDNRSAQTTLGPSEIGTPCDRRLAMALLGVVPVNPGGDGWAAFVGTCTHAGMADVYTFADAGTGRYAVELPVFLGMPTVPRGTTDALDRREGEVIDWKVMGAYSLKKFKLEGPSKTYRVQAHVYGLGAERGGEKVNRVAIVGLPRAGSSLDEMHVWTEKYDRKFAQAALDRVEMIANEISVMSGEATVRDDVPSSAMEAAATFSTDDPYECRFCAFHLKGDKDMNRGCPGANG